MTYVSRHMRLLLPKWLEKGDEGYIYALHRKRSDQKLKFYNSCEDLRAWVDDECLRTQHFVESMSEKEFLGKAPFGIFGRFIPISFLADSISQMAGEKKNSIQELFPVKGSKKRKKPCMAKKPAQVSSMEYKNENKEQVEIKPIKSEPVPKTPLEEEVPTEQKDAKPNEVPTISEKWGVLPDAHRREPEAHLREPKPDKQDDNLLCLDLLCKYSVLLRQALGKLDKINCAVNIPEQSCICEEGKFRNDFSFQEFFTNRGKALMDDSENSDSKIDDCCHCCCPGDNIEESLPPTPEPSICPYVSYDEFPSDKLDQIEEDLLKKLSIYQQRLNQIDEFGKDLNEEINHSWETAGNRQESDKVQKIREKLREITMERICITRQKCKVLTELKTIKLSANERFAKSDLAVTDKESSHFGKFPSCQCAFEEHSLETSSSERKSQGSFSFVVRDSVNEAKNISQLTFKVTKSNDKLIEPRAQSEANVLKHENALKEFERRISAYECLDKEVEVLKQQAMETEYYREELRKHCECTEKMERANEEEKARLCEEIERLICSVKRLKTELKETSQEVDYWHGKDEQIAILENELKVLKKKLSRSQGDYKEELNYTSKLEELVKLQRDEIGNLMLQIKKMSKFITSEKNTAGTRMTDESPCETKIRSRSYSPDVKKCVQISESNKIVKNFIDRSDCSGCCKQTYCCCTIQDQQSSQQRITRQTEPRASVKFEMQKHSKTYKSPRNRKF